MSYQQVLTHQQRIRQNCYDMLPIVNLKNERESNLAQGCYFFDDKKFE